jgi:pimeloyl-ACP methyl ester carboxylesterase
MKEIGVPKAALIGQQSMGAGVALQMAMKYPQMVERMVLVNGGPRRRSGSSSRRRSMSVPPG